MKYPFQPEILDALPEELAELYRGLEDTLLTEICSRLKLRDELNEVTVQDIKALRAHGIDLEEIERAIRKTTGISEQKLKKILDDVVKRNQQYYTSVIDLEHITQPETLVSIEDTWAIYQQTKRDLRNITQSMGFLVDAGRTMLPPAKAYQWALDNAVMQVQSGAINYKQAIKTAVKQLADSGLKIVDYESGHRDQIDVAARRAVMTGVSQICAKYTEQSAEYLETPYFEVSAHSGARDKPGRPRGQAIRTGKAGFTVFAQMTFTRASTRCADWGPWMVWKEPTAATGASPGSKVCLSAPIPMNSLHILMMGLAAHLMARPTPHMRPHRCSDA